MNKSPNSSLNNSENTSAYNGLKPDDNLCDGIISLIDNVKIRVHRAILSASSDYFKACFTYATNQNECYKETEINIEATENIMRIVLEFIYTGYCDISWDIIEDLLPVANYFAIIDLLNICCKFLLEELKLYNCFGIYMLSKYYSCIELMNKTMKYILHNFKEIALDNEEIYEVSANELSVILSDENLNVENEDIVFDVIKKWAEIDINNRIKELPTLLKCVRFGLMGPRFFCQRFMAWPIVKEDQECQQILLPALSYLTELSLRTPKISDYNHPLSRPRVPNEIIMVIGGWSRGSPTNSIETYDPRADVWLRMKNIDTRRAYHGICTINKKVYVVGGFDGRTHYNSVRCYNPQINMWEEKACMYHRRCYVTVVAHNNKIYAIGGYDGHSRLDSVETYDPEINQWKLIASMKRTRSDAGAACLGEHIYIVGGFNGDEVLNSCEIYNIKTNKWTLISSMLSPRSGVSLVVENNSLFAIGGFNGHHRLNSVEKYCLNDPNWNFVAEMMCARSNFSAVLCEKKIYSIGGFNGRHTISFVECYDPVLNFWRATKQMDINRSAHSACILKGLSNMKGYTFHGRELKNPPCMFTPTN